MGVKYNNMTLLIDCGFHFGEGLKHLSKIRNISRAICFEPNTFIDVEKYKEEFDFPVEIRREALSTKEDSAIFLCAVYDPMSGFKEDTKWDGDGSHLEGFLKEKVWSDEGKEHLVKRIEVKTIDLVEFMFSINEDFILKLDIEGAEYPIMEKLCSTGFPHHLKECFIEFHNKHTDFDFQNI